MGGRAEEAKKKRNKTQYLVDPLGEEMGKTPSATFKQCKGSVGGANNIQGGKKNHSAYGEIGEDD